MGAGLGTSLFLSAGKVLPVTPERPARQGTGNAEASGGSPSRVSMAPGFCLSTVPIPLLPVL